MTSNHSHDIAREHWRVTTHIMHEMYTGQVGVTIDGRYGKQHIIIGSELDAKAVKQANLIATAPELLHELEYCCLVTNCCNNGYCHLENALIKDGKCAKEETCHIMKTIKKARG